MTKTKIVKEEQVNLAPEKKVSGPTKGNQSSPDIEAVVFNGKYEVRRYSLSEHGKDFVDLAEEFASKRKFTVSFEEIKQGVKCPSCGHVFKLA